MKYRLLYLNTFTLVIFLFTPTLHAEVVLDGTMGQTGSVVGPNYDINASYGKISGNNLFHSFSAFNVQSGETATFSGPTNVTDIFSRVTGDSHSSINGSIGSNISGANLWLINPKGIVFGKDAQLNLSGAFHATTADFIQFDNNEKFFADTTNTDSIISVANPRAFGFLTANPVGIAVNGSKLVGAEGKAVSLVSGPITLTDAEISAPSGRVNMAAVATAGTVGLDAAALTTTDVSGFEAVNLINSKLSVNDNSGGVFLVGGKVYIGRGSKISEQHSVINEQARIDVTATEMTIEGGQFHMQNDAAGKGGTIAIKSQTLTVRHVDDASLPAESKSGFFTQAGGSGEAASIDLQVSSRVAMFAHTSIESHGGSGGVAGNINLKTDSLGLTDGASIRSQSAGTADAGLLQVDVKNVVLDNAATIESSNVAGDSAGIRIRAAERVALNNGARISTATTGAGQGGNLAIDAKSLTLYNNSRIESKASAGGNAGNIALCGNDLVHVSSSHISAESLLSGGANVHVGSAQRVEVIKSTITASALGDSSAASGNVEIGACSTLTQPTEGESNTSPVYVLNSDSTISALSKSTGGGQLDITSEHVLITPTGKLNASGVTTLDGDTRIDTPPKEEEKALTVRTPIFVVASRQIDTPCASSANKQRGSFIAYSQVPPRKRLSDFYSSNADSLAGAADGGNYALLAYGGSPAAGCGEN